MGKVILVTSIFVLLVSFICMVYAYRNENAKQLVFGKCLLGAGGFLLMLSEFVAPSSLLVFSVIKYIVAVGCMVSFFYELYWRYFSKQQNEDH